jgi:hypothetical protein
VVIAASGGGDAAGVLGSRFLGLHFEDHFGLFALVGGAQKSPAVRPGFS